ncbi:MAG TPA: hypothetical protein VFF39_00480 [Verrucomicrobiae bacterium]|nr:hypothetical protein [Verrucomicrobiae bacterium]
MNRVRKIQISIVLACGLMAGAAVAYEFFVGFPKKFEGRFVHRVTVWDPNHALQRERMYYAYTGADGKEQKHGVFQNFQDGVLVQQAIYRDGKLDGTVTYWNLLGAKTQELYYRAGTPYGWAYFTGDKLLSLHQEIMQEGRTVGVKNFSDNRYWLEFKCGELMNVAIDPGSGQTSPVANPSRHECQQN